jgi:hypothetical protein
MIEEDSRMEKELLAEKNCQKIANVSAEVFTDTFSKLQQTI